MTPLEKLSEYFLKFPGVGPRQAKRFAYFLTGEDKDFIKNFTESVLSAKEGTKQCLSCFRFFQNTQNVKYSVSDICDICSNNSREKSILMILEKDVDLENVEKSSSYHGNYFVLGGVIPLTEIKPPQKLRAKKLFDTVQERSKSGELKEVILATGATAEGENTAVYITKILEPLSIKFSLKISRLGRGLSTGTELEYSDSETISSALANRK